MQKLKKGDTVIVIAGKNKKQKGKILKIIGNKKVLVDGVNARKKHQKPNPQLNIEGGIVTRLHPIDISNVAIFNPETQKADKVGIKVVIDEKSNKKHKVRYYKSNQATIGE